MPTRRGVALLVAGAGLYIQARLLGIRELHGLAIAAVLFPLAAMAFVRWSSHRIAFSRSIGPNRAFAGGMVKLSLTARNLGRLTSPPLILEDAAPGALGGAVRVAMPSTPSGRRESVAVERRLLRRGRYSLGPLRARLVDPFGLAEISAEVAPLTHVVVYPHIELLHESAPPEARGGIGRSLIHRLAIAGDEFYAVRPWADGDDLRKIHWRTSARMDQLMIRQDEVRPFPHATLLVDTRLEAHRETMTSSSLEYAISGAASVIWELARQGFALRMATAEGGPSGARWGREAADPLLASLAVAGSSSASAFLGAARRCTSGPGASGAVLGVMGPPAPDLLRVLMRLRRPYSWCGMVLLDTASFGGGSTRERAAFDQRLAEAERALSRAGWRVVIAGSHDRFRDVWQRMFAGGVSRSSLPSQRS